MTDPELNPARRLATDQDPLRNELLLAAYPMPDDRPLRVLSLGAGVQSTTVSLMSARGELPKLDAAIFADTGWEPREVYVHLAKLESELLAAGIPVFRATAGNIRDDHADPKGEHLFIRKPRKHPEWLGLQRTFLPVFVLTPEGEGVRYVGDDDGDEGPVRAGEPRMRRGKTRRTCTKTYKIEPVERQIRTLLGLRPRQPWPTDHRVEQWFGISWDESQRMSDPTRPAISHAYPLVDRRITREHCHEILARYGWTAPRSACVGCPFHSDEEWLHLRDDSPDEWADAVEFDRTFRARQEAGLMPLVGKPFLHPSRVPLDQAPIEKGRTTFEADAAFHGVQESLFGETCEGFCGT